MGKSQLLGELNVPRARKDFSCVVIRKIDHGWDIRTTKKNGTEGQLVEHAQGPEFSLPGPQKLHVVAYV